MTEDFMPLDAGSLASELLAELVGEIATYEFRKKRNYDFLAIQKGFAKASSQFFRDEIDALLKPAVRDLIVQVREPDEIDDHVLVLLMGLRDLIQASGKSFRIYPQSERTEIFGENSCADLHQALNQLQLVPPHTLDPEVIEVFCTSTEISYATQVRTQVHFLHAEARDPEMVHPLISGSIEFSGGGVLGTAIISMNVDVLEKTMERMVGSLEGVELADIWNGACELINIIAGHAKSRLNESGYQLSLSALPNLIPPEFQPVLSKPDGSVGVIVQMSSDLGPFELEVRFFEQRKKKKKA